MAKEKTTKVETKELIQPEVKAEVAQDTTPVKDVVYFAKVKEGAICPSKRHEDGAYDFYACFEQDEMILPLHKPTLVPSGIATAMSSKYRLNLKHERGSTGLLGMAVLSGMIDSGFRGEIFIDISPSYKTIIISKTFPFPIGKKGKPEPVELDREIYYPYELAICQGTLEFVPDVEEKEISYEELLQIPSVRGTGMLGDSGK